MVYLIVIDKTSRRSAPKLDFCRTSTPGMRSGLLLLLTLAVSTAWARKAATAAPPSRQHHHSAASLALKRHPTTEVRFNATFATAMSGGLYNITRIREDVSQVLCRGDVTNSTPPFLSTMRFEHHFGLGAQLNNFLYRIMQLNLRAENLGWPSLELERLRLTWSSHGEIVDGTRCPSKTHRVSSEITTVNTALQMSRRRTRQWRWRHEPRRCGG